MPIDNATTYGSGLIDRIKWPTAVEGDTRLLLRIICDGAPLSPNELCFDAIATGSIIIWLSSEDTDSRLIEVAELRANKKVALSIIKWLLLRSSNDAFTYLL